MTDTVVLVSLVDGEKFTVARGVADMCGLVRNIIADIEVNDGESLPPLPIPDVKGRILALVIKYCEHHHANPDLYRATRHPDAIDDLVPWDLEFCNVDNETLFDLVNAADFLKAKSLLECLCKTIANLIKGKTAEEIRAKFNIQEESGVVA